MATVLEFLRGDSAVPPDSLKTIRPWKIDTLGGRGAVLPHGLIQGAQVLRDFSFRPPTTALAVAIGELRAKPELESKPGRLVTHALAEALDSLCGQAFTGKDGLSQGARINLLESLPYEDVVYLVFYRAKERRSLRRPMPAPSGFECPRCNKPMPEFRFELEKTCFPAWDFKAGEPPRVVTALSAPWRYSDAIPAIERLVQGAPSWGRVVRNLTETQWKNDALLDRALAAASILAGDDGEEGGMLGALDPSALDSLPETDTQLLAEGSRHCGGEIMPYCPVACEFCGQQIPVPLSWRQVGFF